MTDESKSAQKNIVFPDTVRNAHSTNVFLWNGSPHPTLVERIGAWIFGLLLIGYGLACITWVLEDIFQKPDRINLFFMMLLSGLFCLAGIKVFSNGFAKRRIGLPPLD